jgi:hypothetical protein
MIYSLYLFLDFLVYMMLGEQTKILFEMLLVFIIRLKKLLIGSLIYLIKKVYIDCWVLREKIVDIFLF